MSQSQSTSFDADDPRLTAYVLDELEPAERAELEQLLASSPEARAAVGEIRETIGVLNSAYDSEPLRELEPLQSNGAVVIRSDSTADAATRNGTVSRPKMSRRAILSLVGTIIAASLFVAIMAYDRVDDPKNKRFGEVIAFHGTIPNANKTTSVKSGEQLEAQVGSDFQLANTELWRLQQSEALGKQPAGQPSGDDSLMLMVTPRIIVDSEQQDGLLPQATSAGTPVAPLNNSSTLNWSAPNVSTEIAPQVGTGVYLTDGNGRQLGADPSLLPGQRFQSRFGITPRLSTAVPVTPKNPNPSGEEGRTWSYVVPTTTAPTSTREEAERLSEQMKQRIAAANVELKSRKEDVYWNALDDVETAAIGEKVVAPEPAGRPSLQYESRTPQPNAEAYEPIIENDFLAPTAAPLSTFGVDVDTASYSNVRRFLTQNQLPPANAVRIEELLNYFKYSDPAPQGDKPFSCGLEAAACPWNPDNILVRIGLKGKEIPRTERPASNLVFLIDVSGSMKDDNKLPLVKSGLELLVGELTANDRVAIVTYAGHAGVALEPTAGNEKPKILQVIQGLSAEGSTNGEGGLKLAYEQATRSFITNGTNRVILCTDGDFNVGVSDDNELVQIIGRQAKSGVYLRIFGFGMGNIKDAKLEKLADRGNGHYGYIDGIREAQKVFVEEMTGTLYTIAKDVKVQIEFNPGRVGAYRLIGYENRVMAAQDFRNDAKDSGDIGAGHSVTALYEIIPVHKMLGKQPLKYQPTADAGAPVLPNQSPELLTLSLRYKRPESPQPPAPGVTTPAESQKSVQEDYPLAAPTDATAKTSEDFRWSAAVAAFGMILRNSAHKGNADLRMVADLASSSISRWGGPNDLNFQTAEHVRRNEFITLVEAARRLRNELPKPHQDDAPKQ